ncbi:MAG TPA: hypothetical protein VG099_23540 [Gemmataceae bacterium]|nr:hypothetical protein [Gemmataceae bacterium]
MNAWLQTLRCLGLLASTLLPGSVQADDQVSSRLLPVRVENGRCEIVLPTPHANDQFYLILGSLSRRPGPHNVLVRTEATSRPLDIPFEARVADEAWQARMRELGARLAKARQSKGPIEDYPARLEPPRQRVFYLFRGERDLENPESYATIHADLRAVGRYCQVYVDCACPQARQLQPTIADVVRTFDSEILPLARRQLGQVTDVDRDGRFTMLFTGRLAELCRGNDALKGCVRGSDWYRDVPAPFSNHCDMMYLSTDLKPGPYLHSILAHEYTHAILFSEHVFHNYLAGTPRQDEEAWLNEGLAHLAEDLHSYGWHNLDYRIAAFLNAPERFALVVPDYYAAGSWRSPGHRGAAYLFVRWCADRYGEDLPRRLIQSNLAGVANLEAATGEHFAELFRQWCVAVLLSGTDLPSPAPLLHLDLRHPLGGENLNGPHVTELSLDGAQVQIQLAGTSAAYLRAHSPGGERSRISISAEPQAELQVTLVCIPERREP